MKKKIVNLIVCIICTAGLTGCALLPKEDEPRTVVIEKEDVTSDYNLTLVEFQDVELIERVSVTYQQLQEGKLSFGTWGTVKDVYVSKGDSVVAGQLLARLDVTYTENRLFEIENEIAMNSLLIDQNNEKIEFYAAKQAAALSITDVEDYISKSRSCREKIGELEDKIKLAEAERDELNERLASSTIYAPFDGIVSYIKDDLAGSDAVASSSVITVMDASVCAFQSQNLDCAEFLKIGDAVDITMGNGNVYGAKVTDISEEIKKVTFELDEPNYSLTIGTKATINKLIDRREQVVAVKRVCVYETEDYYYVYVLTPNGVREMRKVTPGLIGNTYVEILDGLELNESVVIR